MQVPATHDVVGVRNAAELIFLGFEPHRNAARLAHGNHELLGFLGNPILKSIVAVGAVGHAGDRIDPLDGDEPVIVARLHAWEVSDALAVVRLLGPIEFFARRFGH